MLGNRGQRFSRPEQLRKGRLRINEELQTAENRGKHRCAFHLLDGTSVGNRSHPFVSPKSYPRNGHSSLTGGIDAIPFGEGCRRHFCNDRSNSERPFVWHKTLSDNARSSIRKPHIKSCSLDTYAAIRPDTRSECHSLVSSCRISIFGPITHAAPPPGPGASGPERGASGIFSLWPYSGTPGSNNGRSRAPGLKPATHRAGRTVCRAGLRAWAGSWQHFPDPAAENTESRLDVGVGGGVMAVALGRWQLGLGGGGRRIVSISPIYRVRNVKQFF